jgi:hypothetical protein
LRGCLIHCENAGGFKKKKKRASKWVLSCATKLVIESLHFVIKVYVLDYNFCAVLCNTDNKYNHTILSKNLHYVIHKTLFIRPIKNINVSLCKIK